MADGNTTQMSKIIQFPAGGRSGGSRQERVPLPPLHVTVENRYHQEAIDEEKRERSRRPTIVIRPLPSC